MRLEIYLPKQTRQIINMISTKYQHDMADGDFKNLTRRTAFNFAISH